MKNLYLFLLAGICFLLPPSVFGQAPQAINYQAALRNNSGQPLASQNVTLRLGIYEGPGGGTKVYEETHATTTTAQGLANVAIGKGTTTFGTFNSINWQSNEHHLKVEINAGSGFNDAGTQQLVSVPYALQAASAASLNSNGAANGQILQFNGTSWVPVTLTAGTGIDISGTTITNTGDLDAFDDLTTTTVFGGDVTGNYSALSLAQNGATTGQALRWNGTSWAPAAVGDVNSTGGATNYIPKFTAAKTLGKSSIYEDGNNVGIGTTTPTTTLSVNEKFQVEGTTGSVTFTDAGTIKFANPTNVGQPAQFLYTSGTGNLDRMIISHSPNYPQWGLGYTDTMDKFLFQNNSTSPSVTVDLAYNRLGVRTRTPNFPLEVNGQAKIMENLGVGGTDPDNNNVIVSSSNTSDRTMLLEATGSNYISMFTAKGSAGFDNAQMTKYGSSVSGTFTDGTPLAGTSSFTGGAGAVRVVIGILNNAPLKLMTASRTRMEIGGNGQISMNKTAPKAFVHAAGISPTTFDPGWGYTDNVAFMAEADTASNSAQSDGFIALAKYSPVENNGVVGLALSKINNTTNVGTIGFAVNPSGNSITDYGFYGRAQGGTTNGGALLQGSGTASSTNYGVSASASGGSAAYGVYGNASGATTNYGVYCVGNGAYTGTWSNVSDIKFKKDIQPIESAVDQLMKLKPASYHMRTDEFKHMNLATQRQFGFIAQEMQQVFPSLVEKGVFPAPINEETKKPEGSDIDYLGVNYIGLIPVLTKAIQEQQAEIEFLKKKIEQLENKK